MKRIILSLCLVATLAACESAEERAESHYQSAIVLAEDGDLSRALIELRNVFQLNPMHREARVMYASTMREQGNLKEAFAQYLRLVEQYPQDATGNLALVEIAVETNMPMDDAQRYADAAVQAAPDNPQAQAAKLALDYKRSLQAKDAETLAATVAAVEEMLQQNPGLPMARRVYIDSLIADQDWAAALVEIDTGLEQEPLSQDLYRLRLGVLDQLDDMKGIETTLKSMLESFPDSSEIENTLVNWYIQKGRVDDAEQWLRNAVDPYGTDPAPRLTLVRFLTEVRGEAVAQQELDALLQEPVPSDVAAKILPFRILRAGLAFEDGNEDAAMADLADLVEGATPSEDIDRAKVTLAQMREATGNRVGARVLIEEVLEHDAGQVDALKLKTRWLIEDDHTGEAMVAVRRALDAAPRDPEALMLMAQVYERDGNQQLMAETLALAVEASGRAPDLSLRYAEYLMGADQALTAENVIIEALRRTSDNGQLRHALGRVHIMMKDWARTEQDIRQLRALDDEYSQQAADNLQGMLLAAQDRVDDLTAFLEEQAAVDGPGSFAAEAALIRTHLTTGESDKALARAEALLEAQPDNPGVRYIHASVLATLGQTQEAMELLAALTDDAPYLRAAWMARFNLARVSDDSEDAMAVLDAADAALPGDLMLGWTRAGLLEQEGDLDGAIAAYEALYAKDSDNMVIANNLASLLVAQQEDAAQIERAWTLARRLRDQNVPAFQDTYGWIAFLRGDNDTALASLEPAAEGLPDDPAVQYHLGRAYAAANRAEAAEAQFQRARDLLETAPMPALATRLDEAEAQLTAGASN